MVGQDDFQKHCPCCLHSTPILIRCPHMKEMMSQNTPYFKMAIIKFCKPKLSDSSQNTLLKCKGQYKNNQGNLNKTKEIRNLFTLS